MTYDNVAKVTQIVALLFFIALFIGVVLYAFWPGNKKRFEDASKIPLEKDPEDEEDERD